MTDVPIRDAATVVLLRDSPSGPEVWLLTRVTQMAFAAGMAVFPGGRVEDADADLPFAAGAEVAAAKRLGCDPMHARALLGAGVRETFEEAGVLLTVPSADLTGAWSDVETGRISFGDLLRSSGLVVDAPALHLWSRWVTPVGEARRYDTRFFVCALPDGARAQNVTTESSAGGWFGVAAAVQMAERGEIGLLPPTITTLDALARFDSVADAIAAAPDQPLDPVRPTITVGADGLPRVALPDGRLLPVPRRLLR
jgi:8-oxo-dGTP pyrophosphatase MutT (NUDIX family)